MLWCRPARGGPSLGGTAVDVIGEQGLYLLGRARSFLPVTGVPSWTRQAVQVRSRTATFILRCR